MSDGRAGTRSSTAIGGLDRPTGGSPGELDALTCQAGAFSLPPGVHYLNCAYLSPLARAVEEAGLVGMRAKRLPSQIEPEDFFAPGRELRERFARLVNADAAENVAIIPSASYAVSTCARNVEVVGGANIVLTSDQFPGNVYAWRRLARERRAEVRTVGPPDGPDRGSRWSERILEAIDAETVVVTLAPVHWTDGTVFDLRAIAARAREVGAYLIVDGTQTVGAMDFDVAEVQPDALICAGYKWLLGPYSIGLAYYGPRLLGGAPLEETWIAREGSEDFAGLVDYTDTYQDGAARYDVGEHSNFILVPMLSAALGLILDWRPARIADYCARLTSDLIGRAREAGFGVEDDAWRAPHLFGLRMPEGLEARTVRGALADRGVHVSLRGSALRISPNVYNDERDVAALWEALEAVL